MLHCSVIVHICPFRYLSIYLSQVACWDKAWSFLWFLNLVLHIWCCTVFIGLFLFFLKFAEALKCLCTQRGALNQTEKWRRALSKGNPLAVVTSYHFVQHHQMRLCFLLFCTAVLYEHVVATVLKKNIYKDLAFITWLFNESLLFAPLQTAESQPKHINIANITQLADCAVQWPASWPPGLPTPNRTGTVCILLHLINTCTS